MTRPHSRGNRRTVVRVSRRFSPGDSTTKAAPLEPRSLAAPFIHAYSIDDKAEQPQTSILQSLTVAPLALSTPSPVQQPTGSTGPDGVPPAIGPTGSVGIIEPLYTTTGSTGYVGWWSDADLNGPLTPGVYDAPPIGGAYEGSGHFSNMGGTATTYDQGEWSDSQTAENQGIVLSDINQQLTLNEGPYPGRFASVGEIVGSSNNGQLTPIVDNFILSLNGVQIPPSSNVPYQGGFVIGFRDGGPTSPAITQFGLNYSLVADGITATVNEGGHTGLYVTYSTGSGTAYVADTAFPQDEATYSISFSGTLTGNTTTAQFDWSNTVSILGGNSESNWDDFTWKYSVNY